MKTEKRSVRLYPRIFPLIRGFKKSGDNSDRKVILFAEHHCVYALLINSTDITTRANRTGRLIFPVLFL
ncbi:hypothetical protein C3552_27040 [Salmonella enterica]|nr:hypothetical protein [Salmonella enterica]